MVCLFTSQLTQLKLNYTALITEANVREWLAQGNAQMESKLVLKLQSQI